MAAIGFFALIFALVGSMFSTAIKLSKVERTFFSICSGAIEDSVIIYPAADFEDYIPYFNEELLKTRVSGYLESELSNVLNNQQIIYTFHYSTITSLSEKVDITLSGTINTIYQFSKTLTFAIEEGAIS